MTLTILVRRSTMAEHYACRVDDKKRAAAVYLRDQGYRPVDVARLIDAKVAEIAELWDETGEVHQWRPLMSDESRTLTLPWRTGRKLTRTIYSRYEQNWDGEGWR